MVAAPQRVSADTYALPQVTYNNEGLEAIIFTADGDMRQALNNLQVGVQGVRLGGGGRRGAGMVPRIFGRAAGSVVASSFTLDCISGGVLT